MHRFNNIFGRRDKEEERPSNWPPLADEIEKESAVIKTALRGMHKVMTTTALVSAGTSDRDRKLRKIPEYTVATELKACTEHRLPKDRCLSYAVNHLVDIMRRLGEYHMDYELQSEEGCLAKLDHIVDQQCNRLVKMRRDLAKLSSECSTARDRVAMTSSDPSLSAVTVQAKEQLEMTQMDLETSKDKLLQELFQFRGDDGDHATVVLAQLRLYSTYLTDCLGCLTEQIPIMEQQIEERRVKTTFGRELSMHLKETNRQYAFVLEECITILSTEDFFKTQGVFRLPGKKTKIDALRSALNVMLAEPSLMMSHESFAIADVLRQYLRELPVPLFTNALLPKWMEATQKNSIPDAIACFQAMPEDYQRNLAYMMRFLYYVSLYSSHNKMDISNLSIVFGPTCVPQAMGVTSLSASGCQLVSFVLTNFQEIFGPCPNFQIVPSSKAPSQENLFSSSNGVDQNAPLRSKSTDPYVSANLTHHSSLSSLSAFGEPSIEKSGTTPPVHRRKNRAPPPPPPGNTTPPKKPQPIGAPKVIVNSDSLTSSVVELDAPCDNPPEVVDLLTKQNEAPPASPPLDSMRAKPPRQQPPGRPPKPASLPTTKN